MFWCHLWWLIEASGMEETIVNYGMDNFEEYPPSARDKLYFELHILLNERRLPCTE